MAECNTCGKLSLAYNGIGDREAIAIAKGKPKGIIISCQLN